MIKCPICGLNFLDEDFVAVDFINTIYHYACLGTNKNYVIKIGLFKFIKKFFYTNEFIVH